MKASPAAPRAAAPEAREGTATGGETPRRKFLKRLGGLALTTAFVGQAVALLRALWPDVVYEAPTRFKIGRPQDFPEGVAYLEARRLFVWRKGNDFFAMSAICTHLGCTVKQAPGDRAGTTEFHCPCHGSRYYGDGTNYAGPAPRPLERFRLDLTAEDGQLTVDASKPVDASFRLTV